MNQIITINKKTTILPMNEDYYIGQIFEGFYPPSAAIWCNSHNAFIELIEENKYEIKEIKIVPHKPTKEEQEQARASAYAVEIDPLHSRKARKTILGDWTQKDEFLYEEEVKQLSAAIAKRYPYPLD